MLIEMLNRKLVSRGNEGIVKVSTSLRASQYNHITDDYQKKELSQRWNEMPDGKRIQRDLYSAFLLQHVNEDHTGFCAEALHRDYPAFVIMHDEVIRSLQNAPRTIASMGIVRR